MGLLSVTPKKGVKKNKKKLLALIIGIALLYMTGIANSATYDASGTWNMSFTCDYYIDPPPGSSIFQYTYSYDSTWEIVQDPDDDTFSLGITASPYPGTQWYTGIVTDAHYEVTGPTGHFHDTDYVWGLSYDLEGNIPWMGNRWWLIMWDSLYFDLSSDGTALEGFGDPEWIGYNYSDPDGSDEQFSTYVEGLEPWEAKEFSGTVPIQGKPVPNIEANGSGGPIGIISSDKLSVKIELDPGILSDTNADWWVVADTPFGYCYYDVIGSCWCWKLGLFVTYQGPLFNLPPFIVLNISSIPVGTYTLYFGADMKKDGKINDPLYYDSVVVKVGESAKTYTPPPEPGDIYSVIDKRTVIDKELSETIKVSVEWGIFRKIENVDLSNHKGLVLHLNHTQSDSVPLIFSTEGAIIKGPYQGATPPEWNDPQYKKVPW